MSLRDRVIFSLLSWNPHSNTEQVLNANVLSTRDPETFKMTLDLPCAEMGSELWCRGWETAQMCAWDI